MLSELDCKILARACDLEWHEDVSNIYHPCSCSCGVEFGEYGGELLPIHLFDSNRTFSTADDWELVRKEVVVPNQEAFCEHLDKHGVWMIIWFSLSSEDRNKIAADFIKAHPNRFPWVVEMKGE